MRPPSPSKTGWASVASLWSKVLKVALMFSIPEALLPPICSPHSRRLATVRRRLFCVIWQLTHRRKYFCSSALFYAFRKCLPSHLSASHANATAGNNRHALQAFPAFALAWQKPLGLGFIRPLYPHPDGTPSPSALRPPFVPTHIFCYSLSVVFMVVFVLPACLAVCRSLGALRTHGRHPFGCLSCPPVAPGGGLPLVRFRTARHGRQTPPCPPRGGELKINFQGSFSVHFRMFFRGVCLSPFSPFFLRFARSGLTTDKNKIIL